MIHNSAVQSTRNDECPGHVEQDDKASGEIDYSSLPFARRRSSDESCGRERHCNACKLRRAIPSSEPETG